ARTPPMAIDASLSSNEMRIVGWSTGRPSDFRETSRESELSAGSFSSDRRAPGARRLSASRQKRTSERLPRYVRLVPKAAVSRRSKNGPLFDDLVGASKQRGWHSDAERLSGLEVDGEFVLGRGLHCQVGRFPTF